jgi:predicted Zn-dependent peptidase
MINYHRFTLENGLRVLVHEDDSTPMVAMNVLYSVGSRDESPERTGFAHLFEHLMFGGSLNVPNFDTPIQLAGGENNAFTNSDITNFYNILPSENLETAFWLESDRMFSLIFSETSLDKQRKVVVEEFKETCLNEPYGDVWHHLMDLTYKQHPYRWPTIGLVPEHVEQSTLEDVKNFFYKFYRPNNAIIVIAGNCNLEQVKTLTEKWFDEIPKGDVPTRSLPKEDTQEAFRKKTHDSAVPLDALHFAFHMPNRTSPDYYIIDLISDILCNGQSSRLYRKLLKNEELFSDIDCYITGTIDAGLLIIEGKPAEGVTMEVAEAAVWAELALLKNEKLSVAELQKIKNKAESTLIFSELNILTKAMNLAYFELLGNVDLINDEAAIYQTITAEAIREQANKIFTEKNCSLLIYKANGKYEYDEEDDDDEE